MFFLITASSTFEIRDWVVGVKTRAQRLAEAIREEVSDILKNEIKDPRVGFVSITRVDVSTDLRHARVYVSVYGEVDKADESLRGLESARGFIRSELGRRIRLRHTPEIVFSLDHSIKHGARITQLLNELHGGTRCEGPRQDKSKGDVKE